MQNVDTKDINGLPPEMLEKIFDFLSPKDLQASSEVCELWNSILNRDRFVKKMMLLVRPSSLCSLRSLESIMRPFPEIHIVYKESGEGHRSRIFCDRVQELLKWDVTKDNLEVLRVSMSMENANRILRDLGNIEFKKLMKFMYTPGNAPEMLEEIAPQFTLDAPALKWLEIECFNFSCLQLLEETASKLERLTFHFYDRSIFDKALRRVEFPNLRNLCIHSRRTSSPHFPQTDQFEFNAGFLRILSSLHGLEIRDGVDMFSKWYLIFFVYAEKMRVLIIHGITMDWNNMYYFNTMPHLKTLELLVIHTYHYYSNREAVLSLPQLETLKMSPKSLLSVGHLPRLRILSIVNATYLPGTEETGTFDGYAKNALISYKQLTTIEEVHYREVVYYEGLTNGFVSTPRIFCHNLTGTGRAVDDANQHCNVCYTFSEPENWFGSNIE